MKKLLTLTASILAINTLVACGPAQLPNAGPASTVRSQSAPSAKTAGDTVKAGSTELKQQSKGQAKTLAPFAYPETLNPVSRDLSTTEIMSIARYGYDSMQRASSYESGYNIGRSTLEQLSRQNAFIAKIAIAATDPQMKYESAYKAAERALIFIANNRQITIPSVCDLVRDMMNAAKTYEDGTRMGYGTMSLIRSNGTSDRIRNEIDYAVRAAQNAAYWEDSYNILYSSYGNIRYMN